MPHNWKRALGALVVVLMLAPSAVPRPAGADSIELLPEGFRAIVADPVTGNVYVSSTTSGTVSVLDRDGRILRTIAGVAGAGEMLVAGGRLYVVAAVAGRIEAYDTTTFQRVAVLGEGSLVSPAPLAMAAGLLWTSTGRCGQWETQLVSIDPLSGRTTVHDWFDPTAPLSTPRFSNCVGLVSEPALGDRLLAYTSASSPAAIGRIEIVLGMPVIAQTAPGAVPTVSDIAVLPGGEEFVVSPGPTGGVDRFRVSDLAPDGTVYSAGASPNSIAVTAVNGGLLAAGGYEAADDVRLFGIDAPAAPLWGRDLALTASVLWDGLEFSPDGGRLYAVFQTPVRPHPFVAVMETTGGLTDVSVGLDSPFTGANGQPTDSLVTVAEASGGPVASGLVDVFAESELVGTAPLGGDGRATVRWVPDREGTRWLWARFRGTTSHAPSLSYTRFIKVRAGATITLSSAANPSAWGQPAVVGATLVSTSTRTPTGSVAFYEGDALLGSAPIDATGQATFSASLPPGTHPVTARYNGDPDHGPSAPQTLVQVVERAPTSLALVSSANPARKREAVAFTASVTPPAAGGAAATGTVTFHDGPDVLASVPLSNGVASFSTDALEKGDHPVTAAYSGDALFTPSTSAVVVQTVGNG